MIFSLNMYPNAHSLCILSFISKIFPKSQRSADSSHATLSSIAVYWAFLAELGKTLYSYFFELRERSMKLQLVYYVCLLLFNVCPPKMFSILWSIAFTSCYYTRPNIFDVARQIIHRVQF